MKPHECEVETECKCQAWMIEPAFGCPVHDGRDWPPRCVHCGRYLPWEKHPSMATEEQQ